MTAAFDRSIFQTGKYVDCFHPEDDSNPFRKLYAQKRVDVLDMATNALATRADARVLDLGGGMGRIAVPLSTTYDVTLCDLSDSMLELARAAAAASAAPTRLHTQLVDASKPLPYAEGSFDLIVCLDLLVHLKDPQAAVSEMYRVLKPGGIALIDNSNSVPFWTLAYPQYVGRNPMRWLRTFQAGGVLPEWAGIVHHHTRSVFLRMLTTAGFVAEQERHYGPTFCPKWRLVMASKQSQPATV